MTPQVSGKYFESLLKTDHNAVVLGKWGGRYVQTDINLTMNKIVEGFCHWAKNTQESTKVQRQIIAKIRELDGCHPENQASKFIYVVTRIRQFIGNFFYDRNLALKALENELPVEAAEPPPPPLPPPSLNPTDTTAIATQPSTTTTPPSDETPSSDLPPQPRPHPQTPNAAKVSTKSSNTSQPRDKTPTREPAAVEPPTTPKPQKENEQPTPPATPPPSKLMETVPPSTPTVGVVSENQQNQSPLRRSETQTPTHPGRLIPGSKIAKRSEPTMLEKAIAQYKAWDGEGKLNPMIKTKVFDAYPFWVTPRDGSPILKLSGSSVSRLASTHSRSSSTISRSSSPGVNPDDTMFDRILILNDEADPARRKDIKDAINRGGNCRSVTNYNEFIREFISKPLSVRYIYDALIQTDNIVKKSHIIDCVHEILSLNAVVTILEKYCAKSPRFHANDSTLEKLVKPYTSYIQKSMGIGFDKLFFLKVITVAMKAACTTGDTELAWIAPQVKNLRAYLEEADIIELMKRYKEHQPKDFNIHCVFIGLKSLLPEQVAIDELTEMTKDMPQREVVEYKQWSQQPRTDSPKPDILSLEDKKQGPLLPAKTDLETAFSIRHHLKSENKNAYRDSEKSKKSTIQVVIPQQLIFETKETRSNLASKSDFITIQQAIIRITESEKIDLNDRLTLRIVADILVFAINNGSKEEMIFIWMPKMDEESIQFMIESYFHTLQLMYDGQIRKSDPSAKIILENVLKLNSNQVKKIEKTILIKLLELMLNGDYSNVLEIIIGKMIDHGIIDDTTKPSIAQLYRDKYPKHEIHAAYKLLT